MHNLFNWVVVGYEMAQAPSFATVHFYLDCHEALGMQSGAITDGQITASSHFNANHGAIRGRLYMKQDGSKVGAWVAGTKNTNQWLQVDLGNQVTIVTRVATQGRNGYQYMQWVAKYQLKYSQDGVNFQYYKEQGQTTVKVSPF